jgi:hypothetical protein
MKYKYSIETGLTRIKTNTKKYVAGVISSFAIAGSVAVPVLAAKPTNPGCFGTERAEVLKTVFISTGDGASGWGEIAGDRAADNGDQNRAYKTGCGGDPAP